MAEGETEKGWLLGICTGAGLDPGPGDTVPMPLEYTAVRIALVPWAMLVLSAVKLAITGSGTGVGVLLLPPHATINARTIAERKDRNPETGFMEFSLEVGTWWYGV